MSYHIAVVVGSLRRDSTNRQLAKALISLAPSDFSFEFLDIGSLPLYSQDYDDDFPEVARNFKQKIQAANGLLFVTPEYNRSMPGVLKNALDWGSRPWGHSVWGGKPGAVIGTSPGATGTALAQQHLRNGWPTSMSRRSASLRCSSSMRLARSTRTATLRMTTRANSCRNSSIAMWIG